MGEVAAASRAEYGQSQLERVKLRDMLSIWEAFGLEGALCPQFLSGAGREQWKRG